MSSKIKKIKYQIRRVGSCFNRVVELNQKMLILKRLVTKHDFLCEDLMRKFLLFNEKNVVLK